MMIKTTAQVFAAVFSTLLSQATIIEVVEADVVIFPGSGQRAAMTLCNLLNQKRISQDKAGLYMARVQNALLQSSEPREVGAFTQSFNQESEKTSGCNLVLTDKTTRSPY